MICDYCDINLQTAPIHVGCKYFFGNCLYTSNDLSLSEKVFCAYIF